MKTKTIKEMLSATPDAEKFFSSKVNAEFLQILGIDKAEIKTVADLLNASMMVNALGGDIGARRYLDEHSGKPERI